MFPSEERAPVASVCLRFAFKKTTPGIHAQDKRANYTAPSAVPFTTAGFTWKLSQNPVQIPTAVSQQHELSSIWPLGRFL